MKTEKRQRFHLWFESMLRSALGGCCQFCGSDDSLEFHHVKPRDFEPREHSRCKRMMLYALDALNGKIVLVCADCHDILENEKKRQLEFRF
jgi:5-methylcytosine-specific restriction endonuclease McrA